MILVHLAFFGSCVNACIKKEKRHMAFTSTSALHKKEATLSYASKAILW